MYAVECEKVVGDGFHTGVVYTLSTPFPGCSPRVMHRVFHRGGEDFFEGKVFKVVKDPKDLSDLNDSNEGDGLKGLWKKCGRGEGLQEKAPKAVWGLRGFGVVC